MNKKQYAACPIICLVNDQLDIYIYMSGKVKKKMTTLHTAKSNENFYCCGMKYLRLLKRVARITVRWV